MYDIYMLMHKDIMFGSIGLDPDSGALREVKIHNRKYAPYLGNADERLMKIWWEHRAVPGSRREMMAVIRAAGCETNKKYLARNLALSITDTYWICPSDLELAWDDVKLFGQTGVHEGIIPYHRAESFDPNASLGGEMDKFWDVSEKKPVLVKKAAAAYGQQSINEGFASEIHHRQESGIPFADYSVLQGDGNVILSRCEAFTSERMEFVPAQEILGSRKLSNSISDYDAYIDICTEQGIERDLMQRFMDYQTLTDFVISNTDRHIRNFGMLRDAGTMQLIAPAPIFDSGNSMFFSENRTKPMDRAELMQLRIASLHNSEEKMLTHVQHRDLVDIECLPTPEFVEDYYQEHEIPQKKAAFIAGSYKNKIDLLKDFQQGKTVSKYRERKRIIDR